MQQVFSATTPLSRKRIKKCVINTYDKKTYTVTSETLKGFLPKTLETFDDKKVQVGNVQEKAQPEKFSHSKNRGGKKRN